MRHRTRIGIMLGVLALLVVAVPQLRAALSIPSIVALLAGIALLGTILLSS
jgi:hypothetical protein